MSGLPRRLATSAFFVLVMLGGLFAGRYAFVLLFAAITCLCLWEFYALVLSRQSRRDLGRMALAMMLGLLPFLFSSLIGLGWIPASQTILFIAILLLFPFIFLIFIYELYTQSIQPFTNISFVLLGLAYIGTPLAMPNLLAFDGEQFNSGIILGLFLLTWTNDTGAYLVGSRLGKTPLFPRISPNKTWEGTIGGMLLTLVIAAILTTVIGQLRLIDWLVLGLIVGIFGSFGDLIESMLKRSLDVKDSGFLLPGHGGLLDRFDGFIFLLPYATAYLLWIR